MIVDTVKTGPWKQNCYIISNESKQAIILDPGDNFELIETLIADKKLVPIAVLNTHAHFDHIGAVEKCKKKYNIDFYLHEKELQLLKRANLYKVALVGSAGLSIPNVENTLNNEVTKLPIGDFKFTIHQTPGHTNGSICIEIDNHLFVGDTLLNSSLIPKNLPEENQTVLARSLEYLKQLNISLVVMPGHGTPEKLGIRLKEIFSDTRVEM